jgi:hypothetical protein
MTHRGPRTGEPEGPPCKVGVAATDVATGLYAHGAIMAGLISRQQTGKGVWIDCNLFETQVGCAARRLFPPFQWDCAPVILNGSHDRLQDSPILHRITSLQAGKLPDMEQHILQ